MRRFCLNSRDEFSQLSFQTPWHILDEVFVDESRLLGKAPMGTACTRAQVPYEIQNDSFFYTSHRKDEDTAREAEA